MTAETPIDQLVRAADPAADLDRDPTGVAGQRVLAQARRTGSPPRATARPRRRLTVVAIASVAAVVVIAAVARLDILPLRVPGMAFGGSSGDHADWLGGATWVVTATVDDTRAGWSAGVFELRLTDVEVLATHPVYYWGAEHRTPAFTEAGDGWAQLSVGTRLRAPTGQRVHLVLQATGEPDELAAGRREDGAPAIGVILLLDEDWRVLVGAGGHTRQFAELLALYGTPGLDAILALTADARVHIEWSNRQPSDPALEEPRPTTPGPLGAWRRANGWEHDPDAPSHEEQRLEAWLTQDPATRPLPDVDDGDFPLDALAAALGTDTLVDWRVQLVGIDAFHREYPWVGLRLVDVGLYGIHSTTGHDSLEFSTLGPTDADAELVAWRRADGNMVDRARPDLVVPLRGWRPPDAVLVDFAASTEQPSMQTTTSNLG